eukprot:scaffold58829_cov60-Phaeocystis_antarctica.AAC.1
MRRWQGREPPSPPPSPAVPECREGSLRNHRSVRIITPQWRLRKSQNTGRERFVPLVPAAVSTQKQSSSSAMGKQSRKRVLNENDPLNIDYEEQAKRKRTLRQSPAPRQPSDEAVLGGALQYGPKGTLSEAAALRKALA